MAGYVLPLISGLAGLFGGGKQQTQTGTQSQTGNQNQQFSQSGSTTPNLSPFQQQLAQMFTQGAGDLYNQSQNLSPYTSSGMQTIAGQGNQNRKAIEAAIAGQGLSYSPAATTALTQNTVNTGNQQNSFLSQIPLLQRQLQQQSLQQLMQAFGVLPTAVSTTGSGTSSGTSSSIGNSSSSQYGNPLAGAIGGFGASLPLAFPNLFGSGQQQPGYAPGGTGMNYTGFGG